MRWVILVAPIDETDMIERVELDDSEATVYVYEAGVTIQTAPDRFGGYRNERIVPWRRILDYRKIGDEDRVSP